MSALLPEAARALAVRLLEERGLHITARNTRGDSVYLANGTALPTIRVSSHARTPKQRRNYPNVATSIVLREPTTQARISAAVEAALRAYALACSAEAGAP